MREETVIREAAAVYKETKKQPGCEFLGKIFSIIYSSGEKKECLEKAGENPLPPTFSIRELTDDWAKFTCMQTYRLGVAGEDEELLRSYQNISRENKDYADEFRRYVDVIKEHKDSRKGKTTLLNSFRNIFTENKGSMPFINFGIAFTIASAAFGASDINFYVGTEEAKDVLFRSLEVLGYSSAEYIPDKCFEDHEALKKLLLAALYHALQVRLPYHQGHREKKASSTVISDPDCLQPSAEFQRQRFSPKCCGGEWHSAADGMRFPIWAGKTWKNSMYFLRLSAGKEILKSCSVRRTTGFVPWLKAGQEAGKPRCRRLSFRYAWTGMAGADFSPEWQSSSGWTERSTCPCF